MTPLLQIDNFYFKREDLNLTGSAKDRAIVSQVDNLIKSGYKSAVISSTGNAAISAAHFCSENHIPLTVFVSPKINPQKLKLISAATISSPTPISAAFKFAKANKSYLLRQSTDPAALIGYSAIGREIYQQLPQISSVFIPVGSGTTLVGLSAGLPENVKIFAVQSAFNPTITSLFDKSVITEATNLTDALTVKSLPLKNKIIEIIKSTRGSGITISNSELIRSQNWLQQQNLITSAEGALALAGAQKAAGIFDIGLYPVILLTGTKR